MADETEKPNLADRGGYKLWFQEHVRYSDVDHNNHVNHAVFLNYFETARVSITRDPGLGMLSPDENFNVVRVECDYKAELRFPGDFEVGVCGLKYGRTSFRLGQAVFQEDRCCCTAEVVLVFMDRATRKSKPLSPKLIDWLKENGATPN